MARVSSALDVTAPTSRHSVHVSDRDDLAAVGDWSRDALYEAVRTAADRDGQRVVVIDYGRSSLYLAPPSSLSYRPPDLLGIAAPPALHVDDPVRVDPERDQTEAVEPRTVSPRFDVLVPDFDRDPLDEDDLLPPLTYDRSSAPSGTGAGTSG